MYILGISAFYHDSAACLIRDGEILAAAQEERFTRRKHDAAFPHHAIKYCLQQADITSHDIETIVFYEKPFVKFERLLETYLAFAPRGFKSFAKAMPVWIKDKLFQKTMLINDLTKTLFSDGLLVRLNVATPINQVDPRVAPCSIWIVIQCFHLLLQFLVVSPKVVPLAYGKILPSNFAVIEAAIEFSGRLPIDVNVVFSPVQKQPNLFGIFFSISDAYVPRSIVRLVFSEQYFELKVSALHQYSIKALCDRILMVVRLD